MSNNGTITADDYNRILEKVEQCRFKNIDQGPEEKPLFTINGVGVISAQAITIVSAQKKSGKSNFCGLLAASAIAPGHEVLGGAVRCNYDNMPILILDTEQPLRDTQRVMRRILKTAGISATADWEQYNLKVLNVRAVESCTDRQNILEVAVREYKPRLVILDGLADMIESVNNEQDSRDLLAGLDAIADNYKVAIIGMIHLNPGSDKQTGWIGTMAGKKNTDTFTLKKNRNCGYFEVEHEGRGASPSNLLFRIDTAPGDEIGIYSPPNYGGYAEKVETAARTKRRELAEQAPTPCRYTALVQWWINAAQCSERTAKGNIRDARDEGLFVVKNGIYNRV